MDWVLLLCQLVIKNSRSSGQDGGVGRYPVPSHITQRTTTNLKTKNNQNCQKIELYGSPTTKELKQKHSSRMVGGEETGSQGGDNLRQGGSWTGRSGSWQSGGSHIRVQINWEEQLGSETDRTTESPRKGK